METSCPFKIGDRVVFSPGTRTRGLYQNIERFGMTVGAEYVVREVREGMYLHSDGGADGWPWNEFTRAAP